MLAGYQCFVWAPLEARSYASLLVAAAVCEVFAVCQSYRGWGSPLGKLGLVLAGILLGAAVMAGLGLTVLFPLW